MPPTLDDLRALAESFKNKSYLAKHPYREAQLNLFKTVTQWDRVVCDNFRAAVFDSYQGSPSLLHCAALDPKAWQSILTNSSARKTASFDEPEKEFGCAIIHFAILARNMNALKFLLQRSTSRDATMMIQCSNGKNVPASAFDLAVALGHLECVQTFLGRNDLDCDRVYEWALQSPTVDAFHMLVAAKRFHPSLNTKFLEKAVYLGRIDILDEVWDALRHGAEFSNTMSFANLKIFCRDVDEIRFTEWYHARMEEKSIDTVILHKTDGLKEATRKRVVEFLEAQANQISTKRPSVFRVIGLEGAANTAFTIATSSEAVPRVFRALGQDEIAYEALTMSMPPFPRNITYGDIGERARRVDTMHLSIVHEGQCFSSETKYQSDIVINSTLIDASAVKFRACNGELLTSSSRVDTSIPDFGDNCVVVSSESTNPLPTVREFIHVKEE